MFADLVSPLLLSRCTAGCGTDYILGRLIETAEQLLYLMFEVISATVSLSVHPGDFV